MDEQNQVNANDRADARSSLNVELGLLPRIEDHIRQLSPHMMQRDGVVLLLDARDEILRMRTAILEALETPHGESETKILIDALTPN